jgi:transglutaminase-like putative cysteine protease
MHRRAWLRGALALAAAGSLSPRAAPAQTAAAEIRRQLRFRLTLANPHAKELGPQALWLYLPARETGTQQLVEVAVTAAHELRTDALGHSVLELRFPQFAPLAQKTVDVTVGVVLRDAPRDSPLADRGAWLASERFIETDEPRIRALAGELRRPGEWETAKAVYDWTVRNIADAGYVADDRGALQALIERKGDCTEYAYLAVALARACAIPARMVGGYVTDRNSAPRPEEYHNWAEVHIDGAWRLLDPQKRNWKVPAAQYVAFRFYRAESINPIGSAHRFRVDGDLEVKL